jgi:hypothetical protein
VLEEAVQLLDVGFVEIELGRGGLDRWIYTCARPIHRSEERRRHRAGTRNRS